MAAARNAVGALPFTRLGIRLDSPHFRNTLLQLWVTEQKLKGSAWLKRDWYDEHVLLVYIKMSLELPWACDMRPLTHCGLELFT